MGRTNNVKVVQVKRRGSSSVESCSVQKPSQSPAVSCDQSQATPQMSPDLATQQQTQPVFVASDYREDSRNAYKRPRKSKRRRPQEPSLRQGQFMPPLPKNESIIPPRSKSYGVKGFICVFTILLVGSGWFLFQKTQNLLSRNTWEQTVAHQTALDRAASSEVPIWQIGNWEVDYGPRYPNPSYNVLQDFFCKGKRTSAKCSDEVLHPLDEARKIYGLDIPERHRKRSYKARVSLNTQ